MTILKDEVAVILAQLMDWARRNYVTNEAERILQTATVNLVVLQVARKLPEDTDVVKRFIQEVLRMADAYGHGLQAETALQELGYGEHIGLRSGEFDVSFAGVTLRLMLSLDRYGKPYGINGAIDDALAHATVTPVVPAESTDVLPEPTDDLDH